MFKSFVVEIIAPAINNKYSASAAYLLYICKYFSCLEILTSLSLSASLMCCAIKRTARNACSTSGVKLRGITLSESGVNVKRV